MAPELRLLLSLGGSALCSITNTMLNHLTWNGRCYETKP